MELLDDYPEAFRLLCALVQAFARRREWAEVRGPTRGISSAVGAICLPVAGMGSRIACPILSGVDAFQISTRSC